MKYWIRKAQWKDAKEIAKVHIQAWHETYKGIIDDEYLKNLKLKPWQKALKTKQEKEWTFIIKNAKGEIVGFISGGKARKYRTKFSGELYAIYILKKDQKHKLGYKLSKKLCSVLKKDGIKNMYVCVLRDNSSKGFYRQYGAQLFATKKEKIGKKMYVEEYYGWRNFDNFLGPGEKVTIKAKSRERFEKQRKRLL